MGVGGRVRKRCEYAVQDVRLNVAPALAGCAVGALARWNSSSALGV